MTDRRERKYFNYEAAHENFRYDANTGKLYRRASTVTEDNAEYEIKTQGIHGQLECRVFGKRRLVKNIIILMTTGIWPVYGVKNKDDNPFNNRVENLEVLTLEKYLEIYSAYGGKDKVNPGVIFDRVKRVYKVSFMRGGRATHPVEFKNKDDAIIYRNTLLGYMGIF